MTYKIDMQWMILKLASLQRVPEHYYCFLKRALSIFAGRLSSVCVADDG